VGCGFSCAHKEIREMADPDNVDKIVYRFIDASVPPQYHRSYTITVTPTRVNVVVDSYGNVLADKTHDTSEDQFKVLLNSFQKNKIKNCKPDEGDGCTGGTGEKISLHDGKQEVFTGQIYHCGGKDYGDLCGDTFAFALEVKNLVPDLDELVK